jgi:hypothetical protein
MVTDVVLFVDANQYLKLYGMVAGKQLLDWIKEQQSHIFISEQIVDEVFRNKLGCAQKFLVEKLKLQISIPNHLLGISGERLTDLRQNIQKSADELDALIDDVLGKISRSEDEVSQGLSSLFEEAISPRQDQLDRARDRKERGNPPGKQKDTLGDQITWEQLLVHCKGRKHLWIITSDSDYGIKHDKKMLLNSLLRRDLNIACGVELAVHYFDNWSQGMTDFRKNVGVTPDKLPTPTQIEDIKKEEETLPLPRPSDWIFTAREAASASRRRMETRKLLNQGLMYYLDAGQGGGGFIGNPGVIEDPPTEPEG